MTLLCAYNTRLNFESELFFMEMKDVIISITGMQLLDGGRDDQIELSTGGKYGVEGDETVFSYMESELTGMEGTKTSFSVKPSGVIMSREGSLNTRMVFEEGKKHFFLYETPYGAVTMGVDTHRINNHLREDGGDIEIDYVLDFDHVVIGRNKFKINVREQKRHGLHRQPSAQ